MNMGDFCCPHCDDGGTISQRSNGTLYCTCCGFPDVGERKTDEQAKAEWYAALESYEPEPLPKIEPCPFCGREQTQEVDYDKVRGIECIECYNCGAVGPRADDYHSEHEHHLSLITKWNKAPRHAPPTEN